MDSIVQLVSSIDTEHAGVRYALLACIAFLVVFSSQFSAWFVKKLLKRMLNKASTTKNKLDNVLLEASIRPLTLAIKAAGILLALLVISIDIENSLFQTLLGHTYVIFIPLGAWFLMSLASSYEKSYINAIENKKSNKDATTIQAVTKLIRLSIIVITTLIILQNLGINISGLVAAGGIGGIAIGFAAKDLLANFFGGIMLYMEQPFKVGDWIRSPDREIEGTVTDIGLRSTAIRTFDQRPLYVPNSVFTQIAIENPSRMKHRRIYETIGVRYQDINQLQTIVGQIRDYLHNSEDIEQRATLMVHVNTFAPSSVDFFIYCFTKTTDWKTFHAIKERVLLRVSGIISENSAEIAFPTSTIHFVPEQDGTVPFDAEA